MATDGVILTAASDIQVVFPDLASSPKAAQNMSEAARLTLRFKNDSLFDLRVSLSLVEAKRAGRFAATEIAVLPNGPIERVTTKKAGPTWRPPCERFGRLVNERAEAFVMMLDAA